MGTPVAIPTKPMATKIPKVQTFWSQVIINGMVVLLLWSERAEDWQPSGLNSLCFNLGHTIRPQIEIARLDRLPSPFVAGARPIREMLLILHATLLMGSEHRSPYAMFKMGWLLKRAGAKMHQRKTHQRKMHLQNLGVFLHRCVSATCPSKQPLNLKLVIVFEQI